MNYYEILNILPSSSQQEVTNAYEEKIMNFYYNKEDNTLNTTTIESINDAYETLSILSKRREYDHSLGIEDIASYLTYTKNRDELEFKFDDNIKHYLFLIRGLNNTYDNAANSIKVIYSNIKNSENIDVRCDNLHNNLLILDNHKNDIKKYIDNIINSSDRGLLLALEFILKKGREVKVPENINDNITRYKNAYLHDILVSTMEYLEKVAYNARDDLRMEFLKIIILEYKTISKKYYNHTEAFTSIDISYKNIFERIFKENQEFISKTWRSNFLSK